jgi:hypothetical protein
MQKVFVPDVPAVPVVQACASSSVQEFKCSRLETDAGQDVNRKSEALRLAKYDFLERKRCGCRNIVWSYDRDGHYDYRISEACSATDWATADRKAFLMNAKAFNGGYNNDLAGSHYSLDSKTQRASVSTR